MLPKLIRCVRTANAFKLTVDGEEVTFPIAEDGISAHIGRGDLPNLTLTFVAERVEIVNDLNG